MTNILPPVESRGMILDAPASVRRSSEQPRPHHRSWRTHGRVRPHDEKLLTMSGIVRISTASIVRALDLNDEIATRVLCKADAPARHPQPIGPVH